MEGKRSSGCMDMPRSTARRTHAGTRASAGGGWMALPWGSRRQVSGLDGVPRLASEAARAICRGSKGRWWKRAQYSDAQKLNWSARASTRWSRYCSGGMYCGVPMASPTSCARASSPPRSGAASTSPERDASSCSAAPASRASPKSITYTRPVLERSTLVGLKSRCTSPTRCAATSPSPAWRKRRSVSRHECRSSRIHSCSVLPWMNSMARKTWEPKVPTS
jgi:hypothetical protein